MGAQLSLKAAMPLAEILATCRKNVSNTGDQHQGNVSMSIRHQTIKYVYMSDLMEYFLAD